MNATQQVLETYAHLQLHLSQGVVSGNSYGRSYKKIAPYLTCADGTELSVQASEGHYCTPRTNDGPYSAVEVGYPSVTPSSALLAYCEDSEQPTNTVYGYVPIAIVVDFILEHGGLATAEDDYLKVGGTE